MISIDTCDLKCLHLQADLCSPLLQLQLLPSQLLQLLSLCQGRALLLQPLCLC